MREGLLTGFRALDLTDAKGFLCGKVLGTMGVDVIKVERPGGDPSRNIPPFLGDIPDLEKSLYWFLYNTDKRGITLNIETKRGRELFLEMAKRADFILESFTPGYLNRLGLGYEALSHMNPRVIMTSITPFGQKGPYSRYKGSELVCSAMSGVLLSNGYEDRPPVKEALEAHYFHANGAAVLGTIMAHYHREGTGEGQQVDVSIQEVGVSRNTNNIISYGFDRSFIKRSGQNRRLGVNAHKWIWELKDGYLFWNMMPGKVGAPANRALSQWMDEEGFENPLCEITQWENLDREGLSREKRKRFEEAIGRFFLNHTKDQIIQEGVKRGINGSIANDPSDVADHPQLQQRNYWVELHHENLNASLRYPGYFFLCDETQNDVNRRAPFIGEHNEEIYGKELGISDGEIESLKKTKII